MDIFNKFNVSIFKENPDGGKQISHSEVFNIWNALRSNYTSMVKYNFLINFIHDKDFSMVLNNCLNNVNNQILDLEKIAKKFSIPVPARPPKECKIKENIGKYISDKSIYNIIYEDRVCEIATLSSCINKTTFNDFLREKFIDHTLTVIKDISELSKFGKLKGWTKIIPVIKQGGNQEKEPISVSEAYHIWDHINIRYDHINITKLYLNSIHDPELKMIVQKGQNILQKQVQQLEKKAVKYGLTLPERPPASHKTNEDHELIKDQFVFKIILNGIQNSTNLHLKAIIESVRNEQLRQLFLELLKTELSIFDSYLRYGKMKGWTHIPPSYNKE